MNICVVGTGYVGLVTGAVFADSATTSSASTTTPTKIEALRAGQMPIYEPGLEEMVARNVADGRLAFTTDLAAAVRDAPTSSSSPWARRPGRTARPTSARSRRWPRRSAQAMDRYKVVVNKSHGARRHRRARRARSSSAISGTPVPFDVVSNPEFLREGSAIEDFLRPDRVVIGARTQQVAMTLLELYAPLERPDRHHRRASRPR